ncbi:hypothetical protein REPUB_Repub11eG0106200 [Reevesia pubescens]
MQVLGDENCYRAKDYHSIHKLFDTCADLYQTIYIHSKVKAIELMVVDALLKANSYLEVSSAILDPSNYWKLNDTIIKTIKTAPDEELKESRDLILCIRMGNLIDLTGGRKNPLEGINFFKVYENEKKFPILDDRISHFTIEGDVEFKTILFVPSKAFHDLYDSYYNSNKANLKLYDEFDELLPKYLSFFKGLVNSDTLPLNVSQGLTILRCIQQ